MTALEKFDAWMQKHRNNYLNDSGILINRMPEFVFVDSPWPGEVNAEILSISLLCANGLDLYRLLDIVIPEDLADVQAEDILQLYNDGHAMVVCTTKKEETLTFEKAADGTLIAIIDGKDISHKVQEKLLMPGDFIRYTEEYFHFLKTRS